MRKFEVETDLLVHCRIKMIVEADDKDHAIDRAAGLLPFNAKKGSAKEWRAAVTLSPPRGVDLTSVKAYHFEAASGGEKAKRIG